MKGLLNIVKASFLWLVILISCTAGGFYGWSFLSIVFLPIYFLLVFKNAKVRKRKAMEKLNDTLMKDEEIIYKGINQRPFALFSRRNIVAVTNSRIIKLKRRLLGGYEMSDYQWKDLLDATLDENVLPNICGSTLCFTTTNYDSIIVFPDSKTASDIYKFAQSQEQSWEEKRRIREMEETRAKAGGISIGSTNMATPSPSGSENNNDKSSKTSDITDELLKIKDLLDKGILSDVEFQEMKSKILSRNTQNF